MADTLQEVYNIQSYSWDGSSRPSLENYIAPWSKYANEVDSKWNTKKGRARNSAIGYAKSMMETAVAQYKDDLAYWQEQDERDYTDPLSQKNRFTEAGYNMGYLYGNVDSGNSAVGYSSSDASLERPDTENKMDGLEEAVNVVNTALSAVTQLAKSGFEIGKLNAETSKITWDKALSIQKGRFQSLQNQWFDFLRSTTPDGEQTDNFAESIAFLGEKLNYKIKEDEATRIDTFVKYCDSLYQNQSTDMDKEFFNNINNIVDDVDNDAVQAILRLLAIMTYQRATN